MKILVIALIGWMAMGLGCAKSQAIRKSPPKPAATIGDLAVALPAAPPAVTAAPRGGRTEASTMGAGPPGSSAGPRSGTRS